MSREMGDASARFGDVRRIGSMGAVVGRPVLVYLPDPAAALRRATALRAGADMARSVDRVSRAQAGLEGLAVGDGDDTG